MKIGIKKCKKNEVFLQKGALFSSFFSAFVIFNIEVNELDN